MVEFGKRLKDECDQHGADWQRHCIDYGALKQLIDKEKETADVSVEFGAYDYAVWAASDEYHPHGHDLSESALSPSLRFQISLDREIEKAVLFVLAEQGEIASELDRLAARRAAFVDGVSAFLQGEEDASSFGRMVVSGSLREARLRDALKELEAIHGGYAAAGQLVLRFVAFVDLNVTAVRKILKKHEKITKRELSISYLSAYSNEYVDSHLDQLYNDGGLSSLVVTLRRAFKELHHVELELTDLLQAMETQNAQNKHRRIRSMPVGGDTHFDGQRAIVESSSFGSLGGKALVTTRKEPLLKMIQISRNQLKHNTKYADIIAAQAMMFAEPDDDEASVSDSSSEMTRSQRVSSLINLLSTFLYMTNYYIVAPTCGLYLTRVGSSESMAGIVIGMTPNAALVATVLYGWWSNHSYKSALVFAAACCLLGNVAYGLALSYDSVELIMLGRALNGFGSARSINRRFIADSFSKRDRTAASAAFVTAGALGMACGPALAASLSDISYPPGSKLWTVETAPGWIMMCLWSLFLVASVMLFEEPDRTHIFGKAKACPELPAAKDGEGEYLLAEIPNSLKELKELKELESLSREPPLWKNVPVMMTLWIYFILKLVLECLMSSSPTLTKLYFGWDAQATGLFLAFLGLLMFPANMIVARLSHRFEDREIIYISLVAILCSTLGIVSYVPGRYSVLQYVPFGICIFVATNALEGPNMSLLSKSIPTSWAKGIFNTGFLATEAGTLARSVGDVGITLAEQRVEGSRILNAIFVPVLGLVAVSVALVRKNYDRMVEEDDDDDKRSK